MAAHLNQSIQRFDELLTKWAKTEEERAELERERSRRNMPLALLADNRQFLFELMVCREVENLLAYLSSLANSIFVRNPATLRSSEKVEIERVLRHESIEALVADLAESKVQSLSYWSFTDLCAYFCDRFGLEVALEDDAKLIIEAIETRNISVHNRCIINRRYLQRTGADPSKLGEIKTLGIKFAETLAPVVWNTVIALDREAVRKFKLEKVQIGREPPAM